MNKWLKELQSSSDQQGWIEKLKCHWSRYRQTRSHLGSSMWFMWEKAVGSKRERLFKHARQWLSSVRGRKPRPRSGHQFFAGLSFPCRDVRYYKNATTTSYKLLQSSHSALSAHFWNYYESFSYRPRNRFYIVDEFWNPHDHLHSPQILFQTLETFMTLLLHSY